MRYHEIDCVGNFWVQRVASLPVYDPTYLGRLVYNLSDDKLYYGLGSSGGWTEVGTGSGGGGTSWWRVKEFNFDSSAPPVQGTLGDGLAVINFGSTDLTAVWIQDPIPVGFDPTKDLLFTFIYCMSTSEVSQPVYLGIKYACLTDGDSMNVAEGSLTTAAELVTVPDVQYEKDTYLGITIKIPAAAIDAAADQIIVKLFRDPTNVGDTHSGDFMLSELILHQAP